MVRWLLGSFVVYVCLLQPVGAHAATLFVSPAGMPGAAGTTQSPLGSIQEALSRATAGDTVRVLPGVYRERVAFEAGGTHGQPVTLEAEPGAILDASESVTLDWQPAPDVAPGAYRAKVGFAPFTVVAEGKLVTMLNEARVDPAASSDPVWQWPNLFRQGIPPTGWEGPKALAMYRQKEQGLLIRFKDDLDPRTMSFALSPREPAVLISGVDRCVVRGLTIRNACYGVQVDTSMGSVIEGCRICQTDFGVYLGGGTDRCTVRFNDISMDPYAGADPRLKGAWQNWLAHKTGGFHDRQGIQITATIGGHQIHDNFIHDHWDGIQTIGGPGETVGCDIHHNRISVLSDDGLEPNGAEEDCRWHDNLVERCICGFRIKAPQLGPLYAYRNIFFDNSEDYRNFNAGGTPERPAIVYVYHNTSTSGTAITNNKVDAPGTPRYHYFNNLFYCRRWHSGSGAAKPNWVGDYNVYVEAEPARFSIARERAVAAGFGIDLHSQWLEGIAPGFADLANHDVSLTADSPARGQGADLTTLLGTRLPGLEAGYYQGAAPDAGALQFGQPMPTLPRRRDGLELPEAGSWPGPEAKSPGAVTAPNLLVNGDFSSDLDGWAAPEGTFRVQPDPIAGRYVQIETEATRDPLQQRVKGLSPGTAYVLSYRSRGNTISDLRVIVRNPADGHYLALGSGARSAYWRRTVLYFTAPGTEINLEISPRGAGRCDVAAFALHARESPGERRQ